MIDDCGREDRSMWTPRLSKAFADHLKKKEAGKGEGRVQRPHHQPDHDSSENLCQVDPQAETLSPGQPHGEDETYADGERFGDRAGHFARRTPPHFRCSR